MAQNRIREKVLFCGLGWGDTLDCVIDSVTGELAESILFRSHPGGQFLPLCGSIPDQKLDKWLLAHVNCLNYLGGVPKVIVPDNCKTAITRPSYYDPAINRAYWDFAKHYEVAVLPARIREPKDKAPVENSIGWLETWLLQWLRYKRSLKLATLNAEIQRTDQRVSAKALSKAQGQQAKCISSD